MYMVRGSWMDSHTDMIAVILAQEIIKEGSQKQLVLIGTCQLLALSFSVGERVWWGLKHTHICS